MVIENKPETKFLKYIRTVGMTTMRGRGFYYPVDSAMNSGGRIYTVSRSAEKTTGDTIRVTMLNEEGEYFGIFGTKGEEDGWIYKVIELENFGEIAVYDFDGEYLGSF